MKAQQEKHGSHPTILGTNKKDTEGQWRSTILAKKKSCCTIASLLEDVTT